MKKITALLLAVLMIASLAACGGAGNETTAPDTTVADTTVADTTEPDTTVAEEPTEGDTTGAAVADGLDYFSVSLGESFDTIKMISAYSNGDGTYSVDYTGDIRKVGTLDAEAMAQIDAALQTSGLIELNGQSDYQDGEACGSFSASYTNGSSYMADFSGVIPEAFANGFAAMDAVFQTLTADIPEYVPQPMVVGEIAEGDKAALDAILANVTLEVPDSFMITGVAKDEYFAASLGLSTDEGIASAVSFSAMMMTTPYSLNIVTIEEGNTVQAVADDFNATLDWNKWVCVVPSNALIATKDNQVLCLMGAEDLYNQTAAAVTAAGWTTVYDLTNPDM